MRVTVSAKNAYGSRRATSGRYPATRTVAAPPLTSVNAVSAGRSHSCALLSDGTVECWGSGVSGQLGAVPEASGSTPVAAHGISNATGVSAGDGFSCAALASGKVKCWGLNDSGQLGDGVSDHGHHITPSIVRSDGRTVSWDYSATPVEVRGIKTAVSVSVGYRHSCALLSDGAVECWGNNSEGELGNGKTKSSSTPVAVNGIKGAIQVSAGYYHSCALLAKGTVECWGDGWFGQLGNKAHITSSIPVAVAGIADATEISTGAVHTCARLSDGRVACWGGNEDGDLGSGTATDSPIPVEVKGLRSATSVSAGDELTCALLSGGTVKCWGWNVNGELGDGASNHGHRDSLGADFSPTPVPVAGITSATEVGAGDVHVCARLANGTARCWGNNGWKQLGNGALKSSSVPVEVIARVKGK